MLESPDLVGDADEADESAAGPSDRAFVCDIVGFESAKRHTIDGITNNRKPQNKEIRLNN